jgi:hypothetical protein
MLCAVGNLAYRLGKKLECDPMNLRAKNCPEADRLIGKYSSPLRDPKF